MSDPSVEQEIRQLQLRVERLTAEVARHSRFRERRGRGLLGAGIVLAVVCVVSLSSLTSLAFQLDTDAVTQIGRLQVEKHLPHGRASLARYMKDQAPELVHHALNSFLDLLPRLRRALVEDVEYRLATITETAEKDLMEQMELSIRAARVEIDREFPGESDVDKLARLVDIVAVDFEKNVKVSLDALYPRFREEVDRVHSFLMDLSTRDERDLTERERTQKELIRTLLKLMAREKGGR